VKKKLGLFNRILYWINLVVAFLLLISFALPYIPPKSFPSISLLSLVVSPLIILNLLFVLYWLFKLKRKIIYSLVVLVIAHFHFGSFFQISSEENYSETEKSLTVLSYNVHLFNAYEENPQPKVVAETFSELISSQQPDVICIQEFYANNEVDFSAYPYQFIYFRGKADLGHAIFSKYPLVNEGSFDFKNSNNNALYADVVKGKDTIRVYNLHLQSLGIVPSISSLQEEDQERFRKRTSYAFIKQQEQVENILKHKESSLYPVILCGDFNNTPFSYVYHTLSNNLSDAFVEKGNGIGTTYLFDSYPTRVDYILTSDELKIMKFENIKNTFSDHYPVSAVVTWD